MKINEIVISRIVKGIYMGFIMSRDCNEYLDKRYEVSKEDIEKFVDTFNENTDSKFNRIKVEWNESKWGDTINISAIGSSNLILENDITNFYFQIEEMINRNLTSATISNQSIQVYDLNTFDLLDRHTWNTMGDKYIASNRKRYMVNFIHLYSVADYY